MHHVDAFLTPTESSVSPLFNDTVSTADICHDQKITSKATPPPLRIHITHPIHNIRPLNFAEVLSTIPSTQSLLLGWCWCTGFRFWWSWFWTLRWSELFIEADDFDPSCHPLPTTIEEIPMSWRISHAVSYQSFPSVASFVGIYGSLLVMMRTKRCRCQIKSCIRRKVILENSGQARCFGMPSPWQ